MNEAVEALLLAGDGFLTTAGAMAAGVTDFELAAAVKDHTLRRVTRGVYSRPFAWDDADPRRRELEHAMLCRAALLVHPDATLAGHSAVLAHGLPTLDAALSKVRLQRDVRQQVSTVDFVVRPGVLVPVTTEVGPAVPLDWAVIQTTLDHGITHGVVAADAALRRGLLSHDDVRSWAARVDGWPRSSRVVSLPAFVDGRSESPGESLTRIHLRMAGFELESQAEIVDPSTGQIFARLDLVVAGTKVAIEFDGKVKYADGGTEALFAEKKREDRLRALGYTVIRVVWSDLFAPARVIARVRAAVAQAA